MPTDPPIWADVRHAFEHSPETVLVIARRYRVTPGQIRYRARGWTPRPSGAESLRIANLKRSIGIKPPSLIEPLPPSPIPERSSLEQKAVAGPGTRTHRGALIKRFYAIVDLKIAEVERRLKSDKSLEQPEAERETREIGALIKNFVQLTEISDAHAAASPSRASAADLAADDTQRLRHDLVQRLERIRLTNRNRARPDGHEAPPSPARSPPDRLADLGP